MDEQFEVIVQQRVGVIEWNFEQLKVALAEKMQEYTGLVYTEDTVKVAKSDVAALRKLKKAISDKRIEIKNKCLEPYEVIEQQAAELTQLLEEPIAQIDSQLSEYERNRKAKVKEQILAYFDEYGKELPEKVLTKLKELKYKPEWENATTTMKRWKQGVEDRVRAAERDVESINSLEEEFIETAIYAYLKSLDISEAMNEVAKARRQKELILAKERERIAAEERAKAEAEAKAKMQAELKAKLEAEKAARQAVPVPEEKPQISDTPLSSKLGVKSEPNENSATIYHEDTQKPEMIPNRTDEGHKAEIHALRIKATAAQWEKIKAYISYVGAVYREA